MARLRTKTISRRTVEALEVEKDTMFWDSELAGFGVRVYPSGSGMPRNAPEPSRCLSEQGSQRATPGDGAPQPTQRPFARRSA